VPYLLQMQKDAYTAFLQADASPRKRTNEGLAGSFRGGVPDRLAQRFCGDEVPVEYNLAKPAFDVRECQTRGLTFGSAVRAKVQLIIYDRESSTSQSKVVKEVKEQEVYMGEVPLMTDKGSFIINGTERVIVSQLAPVAGRVLRARQGQDPQLGQTVVLCADHPLPRLLARLRIRPQGHSVFPGGPSPQDAGHHPAQGHWPEPESILANFFVNDNFRLMDSGAQMEFVAERLRGEVARFDITDKSGKVVVAKDKRVTARHTRELEQSGTTHISVPEDFLIGRVVARNIVDATPVKSSPRPTKN
jgi:DNA-directed RNA polymerase subunit beta